MPTPRSKGVSISTAEAHDLLRTHVSHAVADGAALFPYSTMNMKSCPKWNELLPLRFFLSDLLTATKGQRLLSKQWEVDVVSYCQKHLPNMSNEHAAAAAYRIRVMLSQLADYKRRRATVPKPFVPKMQAMFEMVVAGSAKDDSDDETVPQAKPRPVLQRSPTTALPEPPEEDDELSDTCSGTSSGTGYGPQSLFPKKDTLKRRRSDASSAAEVTRVLKPHDSIVSVASSRAQAPDTPSHRQTSCDLGPQAPLADDELDELAAGAPATKITSKVYLDMGKGTFKRPAKIKTKKRPAAARRATPRTATTPAATVAPPAEAAPAEPPDEVDRLWLLSVPEQAKLKRIHSRAYHTTADAARRSGFDEHVAKLKGQQAGRAEVEAYKAWAAGT